MEVRNKIKKSKYRKYKDIVDKNSYYIYTIEVSIENGLKIKKLLDELKIRYDIMKVKRYKC